jgi:ubiquinone/menaquinone biosynthesis C-methylase UbiE
MSGKFPKRIPELTKEQLAIKEDFYSFWLQKLRKSYGIVDYFNHNFVVRNSKKSFKTTLEIGAGIGEHLNYEKLSSIQKKNYYALDSSEVLLDQLSSEQNEINTVLGDCQKTFTFGDNYFDRVIAIHVLEHLNNLPETIKEVHRTIKPDGQFLVVIPCEGGLAYSIAREISAKRHFKKRYKMSYDWHIKSEHLNYPNEITHEIKKKFYITKTSFFPLFLPLIFCNLCIGLICKKKND